MKIKYIINFYSKEKDIILAKRVKEILGKKGKGVLYVDDIDSLILNKDLSVRYLILDLTRSELDERSLSLLKKMVLGGFVDKIVFIIKQDIDYGKEFYYIHLDDTFEDELNKMFDNFFNEEVVDCEVLSKSYRALISKQLCDWGFSPKSNGFSMLIDAINYYIQKRCILRKLSKEVYVTLAQMYCVSITCVELGIRKAIRHAVANKDKFPLGENVTNKGFITYAVSQLYDRLKMIQV